MLSLKHLPDYAFYLLCLISISKLNAQGNREVRLPDYPVPYSMPEVKDIKDLCDKIKNYCIQSSPHQIIDSKTGEAITDFSIPNENAVVADGLFTLWTYTHGVVLSANTYLEETTGDSSYLAYNIKFYDFVFGHLPYFKKNNELYGRKACGWRRIFYMEALDHCGAIGCALIKTYKKHNDERYRAMIDTIANFISNKQFRLEDGTLARERPQPTSLWSDDMYMGVSFLAQMADLTKEKKYYDNVYYYNRGKSIYADHGYGPVLYAGAEMIKLLQNHKIEIQKARPNSINSTYHYILKKRE